MKHAKNNLDPRLLCNSSRPTASFRYRGAWIIQVVKFMEEHLGRDFFMSKPAKLIDANRQRYLTSDSLR